MEEQTSFFRDTWAEVDLDKIINNVKVIKGFVGDSSDIIAVVKANGYGHGDVQVAQAALLAGASFLAVAFLDEALSLRNKGITAPILVLGASRPEDVNIAAAHNITLTVFQENWLIKAQEILEQKAELAVHLKLDTGMGRIGIRGEEELKAVEALILKDKRFLFDGIYTHFATADQLDSSYFEKQLDRFEKLITRLEARPRCIHSSNSAAALLFPAASFNAVRIGISMYGLTPSLEIEHELPVPLKEAFTLHSRLVHVKKLQKGDKVSYGATYEAKGEEWIGTLPLGYADGWIRRLHGQEVLVEGVRAPIVGRICMDQCMIKLPFYVPTGTKCTLIGSQKGDWISINEIAQKLETINYEIPCMISNRVPRIYKRDGKTVDVTNYLLK